MWLCQWVKGGTWLWSVDYQCGAGARSCEADSWQTFTALFRCVPPYLQFRILPSAGYPSSSLLFAGFPSRPSDFKHLSSLGWVGAACLYDPGTRRMVWGGGGSSLQSVDLVSSKRLGQGGSAAATSALCAVGRCSCYQKLAHFKSSVGARCSYLFQPTAGGVPVNLVVFVLCFLQVVGCSLQKDTAEKGLASFHSIYVLNF